MAAIRVRDLRKSYGHFEAVRGIDFDVAEGEVFGFLGPNGAGKTTTVEILEGYRQRSAGEVEVLGHDPAKGERVLRERIGVVLQETGVERFLKVAEVLELYCGYYPHPRPVDELLALTGLEAKRDEIVKKLSGGQRRRLDLALGLAGDPELVFLDEPTTGFDPTARREAWDVIRNLRSLGKTIFLTTHYMDEAQVLADRVAVISGGRIVAEGPPNRLAGRDNATEIRFSLPDGVAAGRMPDLGPATVAVEGAGVVVRAHDPTPALHTLTGWALDQGVVLDGLTVARPSLEDVYLELTADAVGNTG
ncbi:MAG TPA: ABC transporter ATP-binding protein [Acidimicrobiales bacterium]|jgi:ABC-2 type transport system ATP-binding protein|nr:ABC transporter ATP-binding protein [Acidimicrobiales bacterium]